MAWTPSKNGGNKLNYKSNMPFTLNGFDDHERNLTFVKTDFQIFKLKILYLQF